MALKGDKKKVIYDISVLGIGHSSLVSRAGVFRVAEEIAKELVKADQFQLSFSAVTGLTSYVLASEYLESNRNSYDKVPLLDISGTLKKYWAGKLHSINQTSLQKKRETEIGNRTGGYSFLKTWLDLINRGSVLFNPSVSPELLSEIDIFHSPLFPIPRQIQKIRRIKKFLNIYDLIPVLFPQHFKWGLKYGYKNILKSINKETNVLCISHATKNDLCNYLPDIDPGRVTVIPLAASEHFYPATKDQIINVRKRYRLPDGNYFLSLSTHEPRKNLDHVVRCFTRLLNEKELGDNVNLVLAGTKGWLYSSLYKEISKSRYKDRIYLAGYIADEDLASLYSGAIGFIYPSLYEGFGLPPLEAMQCGTPVIASNTSSLPEVVDDAGIMVDPLNADDLCQQMINIYRNSDLRKTLSEKSIQRAKQFNWERCAKETVAAYKKALG